MNEYQLAKKVIGFATESLQVELIKQKGEQVIVRTADRINLAVNKSQVMIVDKNTLEISGDALVRMI